MLHKILITIASTTLLLGLTGVSHASNVDSTHDDPYGFLYNSHEPDLYYGNDDSPSDDDYYSDSSSEGELLDYLYSDNDSLYGGRSNTPVSPE